MIYLLKRSTCFQQRTRNKGRMRWKDKGGSSQILQELFYNGGTGSDSLFLKICHGLLSRELLLCYEEFLRTHSKMR